MFKKIDVSKLVLAATSDAEIDQIYKTVSKQHTRCFWLFTLVLAALVSVWGLRAWYDIPYTTPLFLFFGVATLIVLWFVPLVSHAQPMSNLPSMCTMALELVNESERVRTYRDSIVANGRQLYLAHYFEMKRIYEEDMKTLNCRKLHSVN